MIRLLPVISRYSIIVLAVVVMSYGLPAGFDKVFGQNAGNPLLFYSPVKQQFIYRESLGGHRFNYLSEDGQRFDRTGFEEQLPFLYYKNLEKKALLPITIAGRSFDAEAIRSEKQGLEIKSRHLDGHHQQIDLYPLFNNDPNVAIMPFPEDVFRVTGRTMEFINADNNKIDRELTTRFTQALLVEGFTFPATVVGGKTTNLKPFDEGFFIRDSKGQVFHLKRVRNQPQVIKTSIDPSLEIKDIIISENRRKEFYGTIITGQGDVYLISYDNYRLIKLPLDGYRPDRMDFKLLIDPLHKTAVLEDDASVSGFAMEPSYGLLRSYHLERMAPAFFLGTVGREILFPFQVKFENYYRAQADLQFIPGGAWSMTGIAFACCGYLLLVTRRRERSFSAGELLVVMVSGFFGLLAVAFVAGD